MGNILWHKVFGSKYYDNITSISNTIEGQLFSGLFQDTLSFLGHQVIADANTSGYLGLMNSQGEPVWLKKMADKAIMYDAQITTNNSGISFSAGIFKDTLIISQELKAINGEFGIFLNRVYDNGADSNLRIIKGSGLLKLAGLCCNDSLLCVSGSYSDTLKILDTVLISNGGTDVFIALFDLSGNLKWIQSAGGIGTDNNYGVTINDEGQIGITGSYENFFFFGNQGLQSQGEKDLFIAIVKRDGSIAWLKSIGNVSDDIGYAIATNLQGDYFISGSYSYTIELPDEVGNLLEMTSMSAFGNSFIFKYDRQGTLKAVYNLTGSSEDFCRSISIHDETIAATGSFFGSLSLSGNNTQQIELITLGEKDIFTLQFKDMCNNFTIDAGLDTIVCVGQSVYLGSPGDYNSYQWSPGGAPNSDLEVTEPGSYKIIVTNEFGCVAIDSIIVALRSVPIIFAGNDTVVDAGSALPLLSAIADSSESIYWTSSGDGYFSDPSQLITHYNMSFNDISNGNVIITLHGINFCGSSEDSFDLIIPMDNDGVTAYPNPTVGLINFVCEEGLTLQSVTITTQSGSIILNSAPVNSFIYQFDLTNFPPDSYLFHFSTNGGVKTKVINKL